MKETVTQPGTSLDRAMSYIRDNFVNMKTYLESGYVEVSNNAAERCVKPFSILRSGYFYLDSYHEEHPRVFATNIRYRIMSLAWMETYGVS